MAVEWKGDQRNLSAVIESEYYLNHNLELPGLHWRHVTFRTDKAVKGIYIQSEKITVHRDLKEVGGEPENLLARQLPVETKGREKAREEAEATQLNAAVAVSTF